MKQPQLLPLLTGLLVSSAAMCAGAQPSLKDTFREDFLIGAAVNVRQVAATKGAEFQVITNHFNSITAENTLKWAWVHPRPDRYDFSNADGYVEFGKKHGMFVVGHTLVWHSQTPGWVFQDEEGKPLSRAALLARMRDHIHTVVGRYKGRIGGWDVVNEALEGDGSLRQSPWLKIIGQDYLAKAFEYAHEADPQAELYYNDYALEDGPKRRGALKLIETLRANGAHLTGVGIQGHYGLDHPSPKTVRETIRDFAGLGLKVMITELDVNVLPTPMRANNADISTNFAADPKWNPYTNGLPVEIERRLARRYEDLFTVFLNEKQSLSRVTFWGVTDQGSWLNNFPIRGRTNHPLLFDRSGRPKPAFQAVIEVRQRTK